MNYLPEKDAQKLIEAAKAAAAHTWSPYSHFPVGAAVLLHDGNVVTGTNIENASYSLTICAERVALAQAVANGNTEVRAVAVWSATDSISPCGACRQFIIEFGKDIIIVFRHEQQLVQRTIGELLPYEFTRSTMQ
jgi:cytidine deaminase